MNQDIEKQINATLAADFRFVVPGDNPPLRIVQGVGFESLRLPATQHLQNAMKQVFADEAFIISGAYRRLIEFIPRDLPHFVKGWHCTTGCSEAGSWKRQLMAYLRLSDIRLADFLRSSPSEIWLFHLSHKAVILLFAQRLLIYADQAHVLAHLTQIFSDDKVG